MKKFEIEFLKTSETKLIDNFSYVFITSSAFYKVFFNEQIHEEFQISYGKNVFQTLFNDIKSFYSFLFLILFLITLLYFFPILTIVDIFCFTTFCFLMLYTNS